jgi:hypothetical protein
MSAQTHVRKTKSVRNPNRGNERSFDMWYRALRILARPTGRTWVAAVNEGDDVEQGLILLREPALGKKEGDREATLRMFYVG